MACKSLSVNGRLLGWVGLREKIGTGRDLRISQLDSHVLYGSVNEDVMLLVETADFIFHNFTVTSLSHASSLYEAVKFVLKNLRELYT